MKAYCYMCGKDVDVVPTERECTTEFKHEQVYYVEQVCLCPHCGEELYVGELHDRNLNALYDAYREKKGLISYAAVIQRIEYFAPSADRVEVKFNQPVAYEFSNVALAA